MQEQFAKSILFYVDTNVFAGHDRMSFAAADAIREYFPAAHIAWLVSDDDFRLLEQLRNKDFEFSFLVSTARGRLLKHPFKAMRAVLANARKIRKLAPDIVVVAQGVVTLGLLGSIAARLARVPHCCYLPMGNLASECDIESDSRTLDTLWLICYRCTPNFVTIDAEQKRLIALRNRNARIEIVENYIPKKVNTDLPSIEARREWKIPENGNTIIGVLGRVLFAQKRQDWLVHQLAADPFWKDYTILVVGDGPDFARLQQIVRDLNLQNQVRLLGWSDKIDTLYPALDLLLIPSRSEGVPLVMLEALSHRVPVVGTNRDGMKEWLPKEWLFETGDSEGMKRAVIAARCGDHPQFWRATSRHLDLVHDRKRFATEFLTAVLSFL